MADGNIDTMKQDYYEVALPLPGQRRPGFHRIVVNGVTQPGYAPLRSGRKTRIHDETQHVYPGSCRSLG